MTDLRGILPAVVTPFDSEGKFDETAFAQLLARLYSAGVHGLYVCGQTGEGLLQSVEQRKRVAEAAVRYSPPDKAVVIHVGALATADAVALARHASATGAQAISSLPALGAYSFPEIYDYYRALADAAELPLLIYYYPPLAPSIATIDQFLEVCQIPNVVGLKFSDSDLYKLWAIKQHNKIIFNGSDEMLVAGLMMGADGGIGSIYNLVPELFVDLYRNAVEGNWAAARAVQNVINPLIQVILRYPVHPAVKALLRHTGLNCGACLPPRRLLIPEEECELVEAVSKLPGLPVRFANAAAR